MYSQKQKEYIYRYRAKKKNKLLDFKFYHIGIKNKIVVWSLFDDGMQSVFNALDKRFKVISIGINKKLNVFNCDLAGGGQSIQELKKLPHPQIIVASPPCESWSNAKNKDRSFFKSNKLFEFNLENHDVNYGMQDVLQATMGIRTALTTKMIIEYFKPKFGYIENPQTSYIWKFLEMLKMGGVKNIAHYGEYDKNFSLKPTNFLSNINLHLKTKTKNGNLDTLKNGYDVRSAIPKKLIVDIFENFV